MMNAKQALAQARVLWGSKARVQAGRIQTSPQIRDAGVAERARLKDLLKAQVSEDERRVLNKQLMDASSAACRYQFQVGFIMNVAGMFSAFMVSGQGDTWEEAFAKAEAAEPKAKTGKKAAA